MMINAPRRSPRAAASASPARPAAAAGSVKKLILIGSSTGGVEALRSVLVGFPFDCPPTLIVQHTGKNFGTGLVSLLDRICPARVRAAEDGIALGARPRLHRCRPAPPHGAEQPQAVAPADEGRAGYFRPHAFC